MSKIKNGKYLWEIKGGNAELYINGTIHIVPESFFPLKDEIIDSFNKCRNLVLEIIIEESEFESIKISDNIINDETYTYPDGDSLFNHFPKEKIVGLKNYLVKNSLCSEEISEHFYKLKPEVVEALIQQGLLMKFGIDKSRIGIDYYFMKMAKESNKNILELETVEFQQQLVAKLEGNSKKSADGELSILRGGWLSRLINLKMFPWLMGISAKFNGNLYNNENNMKKERKRLISIGNPIIGCRDEVMYKKIEELLKNKDSYFVAVGAIHLLGEYSIIDRLEKNGYQVNRIC